MTSLTSTASPKTSAFLLEQVKDMYELPMLQTIVSNDLRGGLYFTIERQVFDRTGFSVLADIRRKHPEYTDI